VKTEHISAKVLVIGGGGAGLRAALAASDVLTPADVLLVSRGALGRSGCTALAYSDRMAFHVALPTTPPGGDDSWRAHADDIYRIGGEVSDYRLAETLARNGAQAFDYLVKLGVPFKRRDDGTPDQFITDGSVYPRACYTGPDTAVQIEKALLREFERRGLKAVTGWSLARILTDKGEAVGALFVSGDGRLLKVSASAVIVATGGPGGVFLHNAYPGGMTGEGHRAALLAGASLVNMEFIQIGICSVATKLACSGSLFRALPKIVDGSGREILPPFLGTDWPHLAELIFRKGASWPVNAEEPTFMLDVAAALAVAEGRKVYLDYSRPSSHENRGLTPDLSNFHREGALSVLKLPTPIDRLRAVNPPVIAWFKKRGIDLETGDKIEVAPSAQHFQGGIHIGPDGSTLVPSLYSCGEAAGGQHGANRPGGNALLDTQVMGRIAGESAAKLASGRAVAKARVGKDAKHEAARLCSLDACALATLLKEVRRIIGASAGVVRRENSLVSGLNELVDIESRIREIPSGRCHSGAGMLGLAVLSAVTVGKAVLSAAFARAETRGPHIRFPENSLTPLARDPKMTRRWVVVHTDEKGSFSTYWADCPR
jgi:succinate dehydrogenase / fumarate reductase flavoprotein subunit